MMLKQVGFHVGFPLHQFFPLFDCFTLKGSKYWNTLDVFVVGVPLFLFSRKGRNNFGLTLLYTTHNPHPSNFIPPEHIKHFFMLTNSQHYLLLSLGRLDARLLKCVE